MDIWTKLSIISCILSIIIVVLAYYGIFRYMNLRNKECEYYAERYINLPRVTSTGKVLVCMYLKEDNISTNMTLKSIFDQTVHPDQISIITSNNIQIPDYLKKDSIIVKQHAGDMKAEAAFIVPLSTQKNSETKIIIVVDGVVYGPDFIETLVAESELFPNSVIFVEGYDAASYVTGKIQKSLTPNFINIDYGVLIKPMMFINMIEINSSLNAPNALLSANIISNRVVTNQIKYGEIFHATNTINKDEIKMIQLTAAYFSL